eukprot:TRINITY_DN1844_c7_g1_i2.p1 TRINITY_DN1844_c7_g1~~TRINITY_DN1844_c7_g1_i2.p1  ORF type:complete len:128 (+),score=25.89 TRINITY_DN1844_c7_g1_i2:57-440(+)
MSIMDIWATDGVSLKGQRKCEVIIHVVLWLSGIVGLLVGITVQSTRAMMAVVVGGLSLCGLVVCPPWAVWGTDNIQWVPRKDVDEWLAQEHKKEQDEKEKRNDSPGSPTTKKTAGKKPGSPTVTKKK